MSYTQDINQPPPPHDKIDAESDVGVSQRDVPYPTLIEGCVTWNWDLLANSVVYSREWCTILRDTDETLLGPGTEVWWPRMHKEDVIPFIAAARDVMEGRTDHFRSLLRMRRTDGTWAWLLSKGTVTEKFEGKAIRVLGMLMDVSELRKDIKFLHGSAYPAFLRSDQFMESGPDFSTRTDGTPESLSTSPAVINLLAGNNPNFRAVEEEPLNLSPEQQAYLQQKIGQVFASGYPARERVSLPTLYGHDVVGEYAFWPEFDQSGKVATVKAQFRDMTEQILAERQSALAELGLRALNNLTQMDDADREGVLHFALDSILKLTNSESGFLFFPDSLPEQKGRIIWSASHQDVQKGVDLSQDRLLAEYTRFLAEEGEAHEFRAIKNGNNLQPLRTLFDGHMEIMRYILVPAMDSGKIVCIAGVCNKKLDYVMPDLQQTEAFLNGAWTIFRRHDLLHELRRAMEAAERASRVKDVFLANISHELRTPLNGVLSMLQLIDALPLSAQQRNYLRTAQDSGKTLLRIISDLLDFSRMEAGKMSLDDELFDCQESMRSALHMFADDATTKGLDLICIIDPAIPRSLLGDEARVRQIIFNLVGNALKFTHQGSITLTCALLPDSPQGKTGIVLTVQDTGIGIAKQNLPGIFNAFSQVENTYRRKYSGTGLGLGIVRNLAAIMHGEVSIESEENVGTTIVCTLFFNNPPMSEASCPLNEVTEEIPCVQPLHILVAEDDQVGSMAIRAFLQRRGHTVVCVEDGEQALEALQAYPFHCLFTDITMPHMDGLELVARIRKGDRTPIPSSEIVREKIRQVFPGKAGSGVVPDREIIIIAVSAHSMIGDKEHFLRQGMDHYISKPIIKEELDAALRYVSSRLKAIQSE